MYNIALNLNLQFRYIEHVHYFPSISIKNRISLSFLHPKTVYMLLLLTSTKKSSGFFKGTILIPCFLCLMKNSPGLSRGSSSCSAARHPPSSPWAPVKGCFSSSSNIQLRCLILSRGVEATFHPPHLWFPRTVSKNPLGSSVIFLSCLRALGPGQPCFVLQLQASLWSWGPTEGHYCPFMGFTVWEVRREREPALGPGRKWRWSGSFGR